MRMPSHFKWTVGSALVLVVCPVCALGQNLSSQRVDSGLQMAASSGMALSEFDVDGGDGQGDDVYDEASSYASDSSLAGGATVAGEATAECIIAPSMTVAVPQCTSELTATYDVSVNPRTPPWSDGTVYAGSYEANYGMSGGQFEILPDPNNQNITDGVMYGIMDVITNWSVTGGGDADPYETGLSMRVGSFSMTGTLIGGSGWDIYIYYDDQLVDTIAAGDSLNMIFLTTEPVTVGSRHWVTADLTHFGGAWNVGNSGVQAQNSMSASSSFEVEASSSGGPAAIYVDHGSGPVLLWSSE